jgi:hypothetical protein
VNSTTSMPSVFPKPSLSSKLRSIEVIGRASVLHFHR